MCIIVFLVYMEACVCVLLCLFVAIVKVFHTRQSTKNTFLPNNDNYSAVHEKPERIAIFATKVCTYKRMFSVNQEIGVHNTK